MKNKNMIILIDTGKKNLTNAFMFKRINLKLRIEGNNLNIIKIIQKNPNLTSYSMVKDWKLFLYTGKKTRMLYLENQNGLFYNSFNHSTPFWPPFTFLFINSLKLSFQRTVFPISLSYIEGSLVLIFFFHPSFATLYLKCFSFPVFKSCLCWTLSSSSACKLTPTLTNLALNSYKQLPVTHYIIIWSYTNLYSSNVVSLNYRCKFIEGRAVIVSSTVMRMYKVLNKY